MAKFNGKEYSKQDLIRRVGNMKNVAGVTAATRTSGKSGGIKTFDIVAGQLEFTVMESRCLDIVNFKYKGVPYNFLSKPGPVNAALADNNGRNFLRAISGGMLYTCGFSNVGGDYPSKEEGHNIFHGRLRFVPADNVSVFERWEGDEYVVGVGGEMRDCGLFYENIVLRRTIRAALGSKTIKIEDEIENESLYTAPFMYMYHVNSGFPVLGGKTKVYIPSAQVRYLTDESGKPEDEWKYITEPVDGQVENVYSHKLMHDKDGFCYAGIFNEENHIGLYIKFSYDVLPKIVEWRSMGSADYALGIMPANNNASGRAMEIEEGTLRYIKPFEKIKAGVELTAMDCKEDFDAFYEKFKTCTIK